MAVGEGTWRVLEGNVSLHLAPRTWAVSAWRRSRRTTCGPGSGPSCAPPGAPARLAPATVQKVRAALRQAVQQAVDDGLLARNVVGRAPGPPASPSGRCGGSSPPPTWCGSGRRRRGHPLEALWRLASLVPSRSGELRSLVWDDLTERPDGTARLAIRRSKTAPGVRAVELDAALVGLLREHRRRQREHQLAAGARWAGLGLVFCTAHGRPLARGSVLRAFRRLLAKAGLPVTPRLHDLRHTAVSALLADGVPLAEVAQLAGHANPGVTARLYAAEIWPAGGPHQRAPGPVL